MCGINENSGIQLVFWPFKNHYYSLLYLILLTLCSKYFTFCVCVCVWGVGWYDALSTETLGSFCVCLCSICNES